MHINTKKLKEIKDKYLKNYQFRMKQTNLKYLDRDLGERSRMIPNSK
jgi:hypothetical protein